MTNNRASIFLIRGAFLNPFELQNFYPLKSKYDIQAISSLGPISKEIDLKLIRLLSFTDLPNFPYKYPILNRLFVDAHHLFGLEETISGCDIAHVAETYYGYTNQAIKAKLLGKIKKVVSTVWEVIPHNNESLRGRKEFKRLAYKHIDHFLPVTKLAKKALITEGVSQKKITVIPMGVDLDRFKPGGRVNKKNIRILFIGRLVEEKGIKELHQAFLEVKKQIPNLKLQIVGDGPLKKTIKDKGASISRIPYSQIHKAYQQSDIFCLPSKTTKYWQEQFGMVLIEAMACGLPIITTKTGAIPEVCGNISLYAKQGDAKDLKNKLLLLLKNEDLREQLSKKARLRAVKLYDHKKIAKKIDGVYQKILT